MVKEVDFKKKKVILNNFLLHIALFFISFLVVGQDNNKSDKYSLWKKEKSSIEYQKDKKYKGPTDWYNEKPTSILDENKANKDRPDYNGIQYDPQKIKRNRKKGINKYNEGGGDLNSEPDIETPIADEVEEEENDENSNKSVTFPAGLLEIIGGMLLIGIIIFIVYSILKNKQPSNKKINNLSDEQFWNPEKITKTELELLLETATTEENYRECIRIYFTFILKEIIKKGWIKWKQEKTNYDYILEMKSNVGSVKFEECVRIYDLVWYGEYSIDKGIYETIQPILLNYSLELQASSNSTSSK